jgi:hypothetical protein
VTLYITISLGAVRASVSCFMQLVLSVGALSTVLSVRTDHRMPH